MADLQEIMDPLLTARHKLREEFARLHKKVLDISRNDEMCRLLMTIPGVGPVVSLAFRFACSQGRFRCHAISTLSQNDMHGIAKR